MRHLNLHLFLHRPAPPSSLRCRPALRRGWRGPPAGWLVRWARLRQATAANRLGRPRRGHSGCPHWTWRWSGPVPGPPGCGLRVGRTAPQRNQSRRPWPGCPWRAAASATRWQMCAAGRRAKRVLWTVLASALKALTPALAPVRWQRPARGRAARRAAVHPAAHWLRHSG